MKKVVKKLSDVDPGNRKTGVVLGVVRAQDRNHWDGTDKVTAPPTPRDTGWWSSTAREFIGAEAIKASQNLMEANPIVGFYVNVPEFNYMAPEVPMHDWYGTIPPEILAAIKHYPMFRVLDGTSGIDDIEPTDIVYVGWENPNADGSGGKGPYIVGLKEKGPRKYIPTNKASNIPRTAPPSAAHLQQVPGNQHKSKTGWNLGPHPSYVAKWAKNNKLPSGNTLIEGVGYPEVQSIAEAQHVFFKGIPGNRRTKYPANPAVPGSKGGKGKEAHPNAYERIFKYWNSVHSADRARTKAKDPSNVKYPLERSLYFLCNERFWI